ncbi:MAG: ABC transporter permease, partial [Pyrinomonadaceae bacterium]|nr:ABC transporter permease [Pyrinomonadaceae bacterium]
MTSTETLSQLEKERETAVVINSTPISRISVIARNAFREAVRDRVLYNLVLFVLLIIAAAIFLGDLTDGQEARTIVNFGLSAMLVFGAFIATFVGVGLVSKEIERRTVFAIFAKPVARSEFIIGKYLGLCATLAVNVAVMSVGISLALLYVGGGKFVTTIWATIFLIFLELTIITAVAILFSSFSGPVLSSLMTFFVFVIGHLSASLRDFAESLGTASAKISFNFLYYLLPNLSNFSFITIAAHGETPTTNQFVGATLYALVYVS